MALRAAGRPLTRSELRAELGIAADDARPFHAMAGVLPFVEVDARRWGLVERDVPGGTKAFDAALTVLARAGCATSHDAKLVIAQMPGPHDSWTSEMSVSAYRVLKSRRAAFAAEGTGVRVRGSL